MKILITGAEGFIGLALVNHLVAESKQDDEIICMIRKEESSVLPISSKIKIVSHDLLNSNLPLLPLGIDIIIHLAAISKTFLSSSDGREQLLANILATSNVLKIAEETNVKKLIFASSVYVYSGIKARSFNEKMPLHPIEPLGISKHTSEMILRSHAKSSNLTILAMRLFTVYGAGSKETQFIPEAIKKFKHSDKKVLFGNPSVKRDFIYITDVVRAFKLAIDTNIFKGFHALNIASGKPHSIKETVEMIKRLTSSTKKINFIEQNENDRSIDLDHCGNIYFAKKHLKWSPIVSFEEGLKDTINVIK
tara:strand:- start:80 stop:1000 length:921 start_codon:yes stop_codon:yes gene_type:complete